MDEVCVCVCVCMCVWTCDTTSLAYYGTVIKSNSRLHIKPVAVLSDVFTSREKDVSSWTAKIAKVSCNWATPSLSRTVMVV